MMHFEVYESKGKWRWRLRAANGENIGHGQGYTSKENCLAVITLIKTALGETPVEFL